MSSFRKTKTVLRESSGAYVNGLWAAGTRITISINASTQPMGKEMYPLPEGRHISDLMRFYSDDRLQVTQDGEGVQPDIIVHNGYGYELKTIFENQSDVINHYKYIGIKAFKFTTASDWIAGTTKRP